MKQCACWAALGRLAKWAEPHENMPRALFKRVGWNGDHGHGDPAHCRASRGCFAHLHLSRQHGDTPRGHPAPWVDVIRYRPLG